jgi:transcription elongation factor Elf1
MSAPNDVGCFDAEPPILMSDNTPFEHQLKLKPGRIVPREHGGSCMTYEAERLAACPFCGFDSQCLTTVTTGAGMFDALSCQQCGATGAYNVGNAIRGTKEQRWNTRADAGHAAGRAGAIAEIVAWLRNDAEKTEKEAGSIMAKMDGVTAIETQAWTDLVATKRGIADAIERHNNTSPPAIEGMGE